MRCLGIMKITEIFRLKEMNRNINNTSIHPNSSLEISHNGILNHPKHLARPSRKISQFKPVY